MKAKPGLKPHTPLRDSGKSWIGMIPAHWRIHRLKFHMPRIEQGWSPQCDSFPANDDEWGVLKVGAVNGWEFDPGENKRLPYDLQPQVEYEVRHGDLLMSRANTTQLLGRVALVRTVRPRLMFCDKHYRLTLNENEVCAEFLVYYLRSTVGHFEFERDATGASNSMQNIGQDSVSNVWVVLPPLENQRQIAAYLDREAWRIDALIAAKERFLALLAEKRQALITHAVTRGLNSAAPLRDSGIPWLGEIPEHWELSKFNHCVHIAEGQVDPEVEPYCDMPLIAPNHIESGTGRLLLTETAAEQAAISGKYLCRAGDVIYSKIRPALRKAILSDVPCLCSADMYPLSAGTRLIPKYLLWFILSEPFSAWAVLESDRVAMPKINRESLSEIRLPIPPREEQAAIVNHVNLSAARFDNVRMSTERTLDLLRERRSALIAAAVTGHLEVEA